MRTPVIVSVFQTVNIAICFLHQQKANYIRKSLGVARLIKTFPPFTVPKSSLHFLKVTAKCLPSAAQESNPYFPTIINIHSYRNRMFITVFIETSKFHVCQTHAVPSHLFESCFNIFSHPHLNEQK